MPTADTADGAARAKGMIKDKRIITNYSVADDAGNQIIGRKGDALIPQARLLNGERKVREAGRQIQEKE
jgi:hypothetical protein